MRDDFAVFILSNGRPDSQKTLEVLKKRNYKGKWYIICDDLDERLPEYQRRYGEHVIVFDKEAYAHKVDTMTNETDLGSVVYAREAAFDIAEELGLKFFTEFDDDLNEFSLRYEEDNKLKGTPVKDLDYLFERVCRFMEEGELTAVSFGNPGGYVGGLQGRFKERTTRMLIQTFFFRTDKRVHFKGITNEDYNVCTLNGMTGSVMIQVLDVSVNTPQRMSVEGGLKDLYDRKNDYTINFLSVMAAPGCVRLVEKKGRYVTKTRWQYHTPKILSDRYKKVKA